MLDLRYDGHYGLNLSRRVMGNGQSGRPSFITTLIDGTGPLRIAMIGGAPITKLTPQRNETPWTY